MASEQNYTIKTGIGKMGERGREKPLLNNEEVFSSQMKYSFLYTTHKDKRMTPFFPAQCAYEKKKTICFSFVRNCAHFILNLYVLSFIVSKVPIYQ